MPPAARIPARLPAAVWALCLLAVPAMAPGQSGEGETTGTAPATEVEGLPASGTISGTMDLRPATWFVTQLPAEPSGWRREEGETIIRLTGVARGTDSPDIDGALVIRIAASGGPTELRADSARVWFVPADGDERWLAEEDAVDIQLEAVEIEGDRMALAGSFDAYLTPRGADGLTVADDRDMTVDGNFQASIPRREDG